MSVVAQSVTSIFFPGFGAKLKAARESLGLSAAAVAAKLKLGERQVLAIEEEDFARLPGEIFARGFVRNYARLVGVAQEQLIVPVESHAVVSETVTAPSEGVIFSSPGLRRWVLLPLLALGFFVLLVAVLYYWLRQGEDTLVGERAPPAAAMAPRTVLPTPAPAAPVAPVPTLSVAPAALAPADMAPSIPVGMQPLPVSPLPTAPQAKPALPSPPPVVPQAKPALPSPAPAVLQAKPALLNPAPAVPAEAATSPGRGHALRFSPALDAWIQVVDGKSRHFSKLVRAGSVETFAGDPPFRLVVGEAAQVDLIYDGRHVDLTPFIGQKVARLTLE